MTYLTYHGRTRECCEYVIREYENNKEYEDHMSVQSWVQASKNRLKELDNEQTEEYKNRIQYGVYCRQF
jgi:hypothetical protein